MSEPLCKPELLWTLRNKKKRWHDCFREVGEGEMYRESNMEIYNTICKIDSQWEFAVWLRELKQGLCDNLEGWDGEGDGRDIQKKGDMGIWPILDVWQKTTKFCKANTLHGKKNKVAKNIRRKTKMSVNTTLIPSYIESTRQFKSTRKGKHIKEIKEEKKKTNFKASEQRSDSRLHESHSPFSTSLTWVSS